MAITDDNKDTTKPETPSEDTTTDKDIATDATPEVIDPNKETDDSSKETDMDVTKDIDTKREGTSENFNLEASVSADVIMAKKFLALSLQAFAAKQFEEAGALFAQAAECGDVKRLTNALLEPVSDHLQDSQNPITTENLQQLAGEEGADSDDEDTDEWAEEDEDADAEDLESESSEHKPSPIRRRVTSMHQIGRILAASMEATASEDSSTQAAEDTESESDSSDEEDLDVEADPDVPGEQRIPVSFSSIKIVKGLDVSSPVKVKQ
jgi:hypothetical protein